MLNDPMLVLEKICGNYQLLMRIRQMCPHIDMGAYPREFRELWFISNVNLNAQEHKQKEGDDWTIL